MSARDELARIVRAVTDQWDEPLDEVHDVPQIVNAILAAGYRKPSTVTTVEELEALPVGAIVMAGDEIYRRVDIRLRPEETFKCLDEASDFREHQSYRAETLLWQGWGGPSALVLFEPGVTE